MATGETRAKLDRRILIVFPGLMLAMMLAALDSTIVATSLPTGISPTPASRSCLK